jgi:ADP-dependent NAD(P)H-hydrate dehydratase / NAD(P)H-hydrate epimerase
VRPVLSRAEVRELDRLATLEAGVPSLALMETAGRGACELALKYYPEIRRVVVVCGVGNNGGDGFVVARRLRARGISVSVFLAADPARLDGDALTTFEALTDAGSAWLRIDEGTLPAFDASLASADLIVDALFGTGLDRDVIGIQRSVIERMNAARAPRLSLDLPSGLDADTGKPLGVAVRADVTATFAETKRGLATPLGAAHSGRVEVIGIGIPPGLVDRVGYGVESLQRDDVMRAIPARTPLSHKGSSGRVLLIAGSPGKVGAGLLAAHGALRAGAGLVTIAAEPAVADVYEHRVLEAMTARLDVNALEPSLNRWLDQVDVVAIGPGMGFEGASLRIAEHVVLEWPGVVVVDADAITAFRGRATDLARARGKLVLTPHPGEMARLIGASPAAVEADRFGAVRAAVDQTQATVLLKGARTLIGGPGLRIVVNPTGSPVLATGGTGDVLCGVIAALATGTDPVRAACAGAYVHGLAAENVARHRGVDRGVLAHEVADAVPEVIASLLGLE